MYRYYVQPILPDGNERDVQRPTINVNSRHLPWSRDAGSNEFWRPRRQTKTKQEKPKEMKGYHEGLFPLDRKNRPKQSNNRDDSLHRKRNRQMGTLLDWYRECLLAFFKRRWSSEKKEKELKEIWSTFCLKIYTFLFQDIMCVICAKVYDGNSAGRIFEEDVQFSIWRVFFI